MRRGRPRKNGVSDPWQFARCLKILNAYQQARKRGEKHSAAVMEAVHEVRQNGVFKVSETEVKRVLGKLRPKNSPVELKVHARLLNEEDLERLRLLIAQVPEEYRPKNSAGLHKNSHTPKMSIMFGFGERTNYPRHNSKSSS